MGFSDHISPQLKHKIRRRKHDVKDLSKVTGGVTLVALGVVCGALLFADDSPMMERFVNGFTNYGTNLWTEAISVILTIFVLNILSERRDRRRRESDLRTRILREARSTLNVVANQAINEARDYGWLTGKGDCKILKNANLEHANLEKAILWEAELSGSKLEFANLRKANLLSARLKHANLRNAKLQEAQLILVNLRGADLYSANLGGAKLYGSDMQQVNFELADLSDADLEETNLVGADLRLATFNIHTILPDGKKWTPRTDLRRYTNPKHPQFWRSGAPQSPAYKGRQIETILVMS